MAPTVGKATAPTASTPRDSSKNGAKDPFRYRKKSPSAADAIESPQTNHASGPEILGQKRSAIGPRLLVVQGTPKPQRDAGRLHRFAYEPDQVAGQYIEVRLVP